LLAINAAVLITLKRRVAENRLTLRQRRDTMIFPGHGSPFPPETFQLAL
jgi:hypothetical protein